MTPEQIEELRAAVDALEAEADRLWTVAHDARGAAMLATSKHGRTLSSRCAMPRTHPVPKERMAYECTWSKISESAGIVFATTRNRARYVTAWNARDAGFDDVSYADIRAKRRPELDRYATMNTERWGCTIERYLTTEESGA